MNSFDVSELKENTFFTAEVVLDKTFLLLNNSIPVSKSLIDALNDWEFKKIYSDGNIRTATANFDSVVTDTDEFIVEDTTPVTVSNPVQTPKISETKSVSVNEFQTTQKNQEVPTPTPPKPNITAVNTPQQNTNDTAENSRLNVVQNVYNEYLNYISDIYTHYATHKDLNLNEISNTVKDLCNFVRENRRYVLRIQPNQDGKNKNFLINHSMRSTVLAITIGLQLKLPIEKLIELGVACILHELGQIRLPPQLYLTDRKLTQSEKNEICTHPVISYNILKGFDFPLSICLGVLEHHEKENGKGYPRHLSGASISPYAKIIAVACSFEAITSPRHYKEAKSSYEAMVELLKNESKQYDETVIKGLLFSLSLFPIGAYVCLSDGKIAQVTDVNPENPKNPIVQILNEKDANGEPKTVQTNDTTLRIVRVLNKQQAAEALQSIQQ
jgi:HD-GYP domain-containing protein (c-di-GMP phosphodiesterase class II)